MVGVVTWMGVCERKTANSLRISCLMWCRQYLSHKYTIVQMMHVSGHKTQKTFMDYIKLSSDEIADEIDAIVNGVKEEVF